MSYLDRSTGERIDSVTGVPMKYVSCPSCGNTYGRWKRRVCIKCWECYECCRCAPDVRNLIDGMEARRMAADNA